MEPVETRSSQLPPTTRYDEAAPSFLKIGSLNLLMRRTGNRQAGQFQVNPAAPRGVIGRP
jgi:hypothetical protein